MTLERDTKSVSAETTFDTDITDPAEIGRHLWRMSEKLARRLREKELAAGGVVLKLKTAGFSSRTRATRLPTATQLPETLFRAAQGLLTREIAREGGGTAFRLVGIGANPLLPAAGADAGDLADPDADRRRARWARNRSHPCQVRRSLDRNRPHATETLTLSRVAPTGSTRPRPAPRVRRRRPSDPA